MRQKGMLNRIAITIVLAASFASVSSFAFAQSDDISVDVPSDDAVEEPVEEHYQLTIPRIWAIKLPTAVLDGFLSAHTDMWSGGIANLEFGGEFIVRRPGEFDLVFGFGWANLRTPDGFWLESGDPVRDADWTESTLRLVSLDVAINWLVDLNPEQTWHLYYGLGLGGAAIVGDFKKWDVNHQACMPEQGGSTDASLLDACVDDEGNPFIIEATEQDEDRIPPLIPVLLLSVGTRYIVAENWAIGGEFGIRAPYFYGGLELGYTWGGNTDDGAVD